MIFERVKLLSTVTIEFLLRKACALVSEFIEARDEKNLLRFQKQIADYELLIVDELGFVPLSKSGAELLFDMLSQRYERGLTLLDRLTHHVHILEIDFRLEQSRRKRCAVSPEPIYPDLSGQQPLVACRRENVTRAMRPDRQPL